MVLYIRKHSVWLYEQYASQHQHYLDYYYVVIFFTYFQKLSHIAKRCVTNHLQQEDYISAYNFDLATIQNICIFHFTITKF